MIDIINKTRSKINLRSVEKVARRFMELNQQTKEVSIVFVGDKRMRDLNRIYRKKDKITDILSFEGDGDFLGEVIIDYLQIRRQAKVFSKNTKEELVFILIHGLLHLMGYDDETEKGRLQMEKLGNSFVKKIK